MTPAIDIADDLVTALVPSLSKSLAEHFNVFRVMRHGTHEKQLSNVFAWLLRPDGTHELGDVFQRLFMDKVNDGLSPEAQLPTAGYKVVQEVDTSGHNEEVKDIADIVLTNPRASVVVENFGTSDGHGHSYDRYLAHGTAGDRKSIVVLLCSRRERHLLRDGWEKAVVVTYSELLEPLKDHVIGDSVWQRAHAQQYFFVKELFQHFLEAPVTMASEDRIEFIRTMCDTGESARYGYRPQEVAAQEFADLLGQHAKRQFEQGRQTLADTKKALKRFAVGTMLDQLNDALQDGQVVSVKTRFVGKWEWCVELQRSDDKPAVFLEFGPTSVEENARLPQPLADPDYSKVFVSRQADPKGTGEGIDQHIQTEVGLDEVLLGLSGDDVRLRDAVLTVIHAD